MKNILLIMLVGLLAGCSSVKSYKSSSIDLSRSPAVWVWVDNDSRNISGDISQRVENLGFKVTKASGEAEYLANVDYSAFFDVVHWTFNHFDIKFVDAKTKEEKIRTHYSGRMGVHGIDGALDIVFDDLSKELKE